MVTVTLSLYGSAIPVRGAQELEHELRIGARDGAIEDTFGRIADVARLSDGRIAVLDQQDRALKIYSAAGEHLLTVGGSGEGPGEFISPTGVTVTPDGLYVYDARLRRISRFNPAGQHISTTSFFRDLGQLDRVVAVRGGRWIAASGGFDGNDMVDLVAGRITEDQVGLHHVYFIHDEQVDTLHSYRSRATFWYDSEDLSAFGPVQNTRTFPLGMWAVSGDSLLVTVDPVEGQVRLYAIGLNGPLELRAEQELHLRPVPVDATPWQEYAEDRARAMENVRRVDVVGPAYHPHFTDVLLDDEGWVWLRRHREGSDVAEEFASYLVVRVADGVTWDAELPGRFKPYALEDGRLVGVSWDEFDVQYVEVYRLVRDHP